MLRDNKQIGKLFIILIIGFVITTIIGVNLHKNKFNNFPNIEQIHSVEGVISKAKSNRGGVFIELTTGKRVLILSVNNYNYKPPAIDDFIEVGDSIVKPPYVDTLYVHRKERIYFFKIGKDIDKNN
jgi:hypothetical protein